MTDMLGKFEGVALFLALQNFLDERAYNFNRQIRLGDAHVIAFFRKQLQVLYPAFETVHRMHHVYPDVPRFDCESALPNLPAVHTGNVGEKIHPLIVFIDPERNNGRIYDDVIVGVRNKQFPPQLAGYFFGEMSAPQKIDVIADERNQRVLRLYAEMMGPYYKRLASNQYGIA